MWNGLIKGHSAWSKVCPCLKHGLSGGHNPEFSCEGLAEEGSASKLKWWLSYLLQKLLD